MLYISEKSVLAILAKTYLTYYILTLQSKFVLFNCYIWRKRLVYHHLNFFIFTICTLLFGISNKIKSKYSKLNLLQNHWKHKHIVDRLFLCKKSKQVIDIRNEICLNDPKHLMISLHVYNQCLHDIKLDREFIKRRILPWPILVYMYTCS